MRYVVTGILAAGITALMFSVVGNPHALPINRTWASLSTAQKYRYVTRNLWHARSALAFLKTHRHFYSRPAWRELRRSHIRLEQKASRNERMLYRQLHPHVLPAWFIALGVCETGSNPPNPRYNDGLYEGWINFLNSTWLTYGGGQYAAHAYDATPWQQYLVTLRMHSDVPWSQSNPACSALLGL